MMVSLNPILHTFIDTSAHMKDTTSSYEQNIGVHLSVRNASSSCPEMDIGAVGGGESVCCAVVAGAVVHPVVCSGATVSRLAMHAQRGGEHPVLNSLLFPGTHCQLVYGVPFGNNTPAAVVHSSAVSR